MNETSTQKFLIFYPFFPTYRLAILEALAGRQDVSFEFAAGCRGRAGIKSLNAADFSDLLELRTRRIGPFSSNPGALRLSLNSKFDAVVIAPATLSVSVWSILIARRLRARETYLWGQCGKPGARGPKRFVQEAMNRLATGLLVYGESEREGATSRGTSMDKVHIVNNAVEHPGTHDWLSSDEFDAESFRRGIGNATPLTDINVAYIGRVSPQKRVDALVDAVRLLRGDYPNLKATIVGDGAALPGLRERVDAERLPIELLGAIHDSAGVTRVLSGATVVVAPSEIGLLAVDALLHGVPVLYGDNRLGNGPEVEALTLGVNAQTFSPGDPGAIADAISSWITGAPAIDPVSYREVTLRASKRWSPDKVASKITAAISRAGSSR